MRALAPLLLLCALAAAAEEPSDFVVIAHPARHEVSLQREELSRIFLRKQLAWRGFAEATLPVDQRESNPTREAFTTFVHKRSVQAVSFFWQQQVFSGRGAPPPERSSDASVIEYVTENPGAVGYVGPGAKLAGVKVIQVLQE